MYAYIIKIKINTVFAGVKAAVSSEEKISKSRGAAYAAKELKKKKVSQNQHEFAHMGL